MNWGLRGGGEGWWGVEVGYCGLAGKGRLVGWVGGWGEEGRITPRYLFAHGEDVVADEGFGSTMLGGVGGVCLLKGSEVLAVVMAVVVVVLS